MDGKKKLVQVIKTDHMSKPDEIKKVRERMFLQEKVDFMWSTDGSILMRVINHVANEYKVIAINAAALADDLNDATNLNLHSIMLCTTRNSPKTLAQLFSVVTDGLIFLRR
jgi:ABC-type branched-subunit amino acid transport system substrate-binding protein